MATLWLAGPKAPQISIYDVPIYVPGNGQIAQGASMSLGGSSVVASDNPQLDEIGALEHAAE